MIHGQQKRIHKIFGKDPETMDELAQCTIAVANAHPEIVRQEIRVVGFAWNIVYGNNVSNSHNAPLGKQTNWGGYDKDATKVYDGFGGRVWIRYNRAPGGWGSDGMEHTLVHTGTGGAGSYGGLWQHITTQRYKKYNAEKACESRVFVKQCACYSWDCKIFADDFPLIADMVSKQQMMDILITTKKQPIVHQFAWNDPETVEEDRLFLEEIANDNMHMQHRATFLKEELA